MRDNVGLRETTPPFAIEFPLSDPLPPFSSDRCWAVCSFYLQPKLVALLVEPLAL
jgi:hypothetical protein